MKEKIALIPAYEPDDQLIALTKELKKHQYTIIVIDDGSGKNYQSIFLEVENFATVLTNKQNEGKGFSLKKGLQYIKDHYQNYVVVTMDCDGQHTVKDANKLLEYASEHPNVLVLGKRIRGKNTPLRSKMGNLLTRFVYRTIMHFDIYDTQTGLRAFSHQLTDFFINVEGCRYEYEMNVLLKCPSYSIKIKEIEITTIYIDHNANSHFHSIKDSFLIYKEILRFSFSSLFCFLIDYFLYSISFFISNHLLFSNIFARIISATVNFSINKTLVFHDTKKSYQSFLSYFLLAFIILLCNTLLLNLFVTILHFNAFFAKIIVEILLFLFSYQMQSKFIFRSRKEKK